MKKKLTLVLALCACFAFSAAFAACETDESGSANPPAASSPTASEPLAPAPETPTMPLTEDQWKALFTLENVTVTIYGDGELEGSLLLDGDQLAMKYGEEMMVMPGFAAMYREMFNAADAYDSVTYKDGKFYLAGFTKTIYEEIYTYKDVYITVSNGVMTSIELTEVEDDGDTYTYTYQFSNYGTTVVESGSSELPVSREDWASAFDVTKFNNITTTVDFTIGEVNYVETISYANGMERVQVSDDSAYMVAIGELYNINNVWYLYEFETETASEIDFSLEEYASFIQFTNISSMIKNFIAMGAYMYDYMSYDEDTGELYLIQEGTEMRFVITDGVLTQWTLIISGVDEDTFEEYSDTYVYTFSNWGTTEFTVPFTVPNQME